MSGGEERVPKGYKQTEVGVIPEDWEPCELEKISQFITKGATPTTYGFKWQQSGVPFLRSECVSKTGLDLSQSMYITQDAHEFMKRSKIISGDLLMTITGNVGRVVKYDLPEPANINQHIARIRIIPNRADPLFVFHYLSNPKVRELFTTTTTGQAYPQTSLSQVRSAKIYLPDYGEQVKISRILSDSDSQIQALEILIVKKRDIKQGTMQELLTGKTRLPGFTDEWETHKIGDLVLVKTGDKDTQDRIQEGIYPFFVRSQKVERINSFSFDGEAVLTAGDGVGTGKIFHYINGKFDYHQRVYCMSDFSKIHGRYFYYQFSTRFLERIMSMTAKSSVDSVRKAMITEMKIPVPVSINEQEAIAEVLSDMDAEISAFEQRLEKTQAIKQGMMQQLLTGRIRLVDPSTPVEANA